MSRYKEIRKANGGAGPRVNADRDEVESLGQPNPESEPVPIKCGAPGCTDRIVSYLTDEDREAAITADVKAPKENGDGRRAVTRWFCSEACIRRFLVHTEEVASQ